MPAYTPMANGRDMTVMTVGTFAGSYKLTANDRIGTFGERSFGVTGFLRLLRGKPFRRA